MRKLLSILLLLFLITSCTDKARHTTLNGQVRTYGTEDAIQHPPVKVQILHAEFAATGLGGSNNYTPIGETWTDQDGNFTVEANLYENEDYYLGVDPESVKEKYHYSSPGYGAIDFPDRLITDRGGTFTKNYYLSAYGWVNFHFVSTNPQLGDIYGYNLGGGASEIFYGSIDVHRIWDFGGNIEHEIALNKFTNGDWVNWQETFFVPALDTIVYKVNY